MMTALVLHIGTGSNPGTSTHWDIKEALFEHAAAKHKDLIHSLVQTSSAKEKANDATKICAPASIPTAVGSDIDENEFCIPRVVDAYLDEGNNVSVTLSCDIEQFASNGPTGLIRRDKTFNCACMFEESEPVPLSAVLNDKGYPSAYHHQCNIPPSIAMKKTVRGVDKVPSYTGGLRVCRFKQHVLLCPGQPVLVSHCCC